MGYTSRKTIYRLTREQLHLNNPEGQSFPILTKRGRVWLINHLNHHVILPTMSDRIKYSL